MTLLDRILARGLELPSDPVIAARIERHLRRIQPDPLFRRRLRSVVVNRYVATREGLVLPGSDDPMMRRRMGALGRGVLVASVLTAIGVTSVGAASQGSLPGDALYGVKLELEQIRMQVAPPSLRDDLAAMALDERLDEVEQLAVAGRWDLVDAAADRALQAEAALMALAPSAGGAERHVQRLTALMATAPASARDGLQRALEASSAPHAPAGNATGNGGVTGNGGTGGNGGQNGGNGANGGNQGEQPGSGGVPHDPRGSGNGSESGNGSGGHDSDNGPQTEGGNDNGDSGGSQGGQDGSAQDQNAGKH